MDIFIHIIEENLETSLCKEIIDKYEKDQNKYIGVVGRNGTINKEVKNTTDLLIWHKDWNYIDKILEKKLNEGISQYINHIYNITTVKPSFAYSNNLSDTGYQIQKYKKNDGFYNWHDDHMYDKVIGTRVLTYIWYLNNVEEGGETEFFNGKKIKPKEGTLLFFPSDWSYIHKGNIPLSNDKYICTGWLYSGLNT